MTILGPVPISLWITMENLIPSIVFVEFLAKIAVTESDSNEHVVDYEFNVAKLYLTPEDSN